MKRSLPSMIAGALLVLILLLYMITFQVRFTEVAVVRTFGRSNPDDVITEPGLRWKWPWPIQKDGENKLESLVRDNQKTVISKYNFANFVSTDPQELKYDQIESEILAAVSGKAKELYGIRVESIGISKLALPTRITQTVFEAMKKERQ